MRATSTSFLDTPRLTVRRMMIYVAVAAVTVYLAREVPDWRDSANEHWKACQNQVVYERQQAANFRESAPLYPGDTVVTSDIVLVGTQGQEVPYTGRFAARMADYFDERARIFERAKWQPWAGIPAGPASPELEWHFKETRRAPMMFDCILLSRDRS